MITIREYVRPASLEEAWTLNQKRTSRVIGLPADGEKGMSQAFIAIQNAEYRRRHGDRSIRSRP